ncbi:MAG: response regulator [Gammaproteobacteria bacterium]|nr:response regulator [Gammaproteobacteria bacterium]
MDSTNIYAYIPFFTFLFTIVVTTYIQAKTRSSRLKHAYIYFSLALTFWIFGDLMLWLRIDETWYVTILKVQSIFWLPVGLLFLNFIHAYLDRGSSNIIKFGMVAYVCAVLISLFTDHVIAGYRDVFWGVLHEAGPLHAVFTNILVVIPLWYAIYLLVRSLRDKSLARDKTASVLLSIGIVFGAAISYVTTVYFPDVLGRTDVLPLHDVGIAIHSLFASIAVSRYRFLHIELADVAEDMFARMHDGVLILDGMGKIQHANVSAREMLKLGFDELPQQKIANYFYTYPTAMAFSNYELEVKDDESVYSITQAPSVYGKKESGKLVIIRDISEQKKSEKEINKINRDLAQARDEALESSKLKSQFLANMSHELRTPLNAVIGYSEIIEEEAEELKQGQIASDADKINRAGKHLLSLINDILDLSKIEAGKMDVYIEAFSLAELLQDVVITSQPMLNKNNNAFEHVDNSIGLIESDQIKVRQILYNLVSNAAKFTKDGTVRLDANVLNKEGVVYLELRVSDNGIGMNEEQLGKLYNAFMQADASTTRQYGGTGLGMAITRHFVELLNGTIEVKSELDVGTEFTVSIPIKYEEYSYDLAVEKSADVGGADIHDGSITVLVVDDDEPTRELITRYLVAEGINVIAAKNGAEAYNKAIRYKPDLITLDVMMPGKDGWAVLNQLKSDANLAEIPVVMMSMVDNQGLGYALGAAEYLVKPVIRKSLVDVVKRSLVQSQNKQIMIIEDDADMANLMIALLEDAKYEVWHTDAGQKALEHLEKNRPSMIVLDLIMPGMNGFEFLRILRGRKEFCDIPVIVLSSEELTDDVKQELESVAAELISKSVISPMRLVADIKARLKVI